MTDTYDARRDSFESYNVAINALRNQHGSSRRIELPFPPPLSACFTNATPKGNTQTKRKRGRVSTKRYKDWTEQALWEIKLQRVRPIKGEVSISVGLVAPDKRARDAGNLDKAICDVLVKAGVIEDDSNRYVRKLSYEWLASGPPVSVIIHEIGASA